VLGDGGGVAGALQAHQRRRIGRRGHHHAARTAFVAEDVLDEFLDLAAALADQADDDDVGRGEARHHAHQHRLADAGAGEQAQALAAADGEQRVDRAHAGVQRLAHRVAVHRIDRAAHHRPRADVLQRAAAVHRHAVRVDDAAEQAVAHRQVQAAVLAAPPGVVLGAEARRHMRRGVRQHAGAAGQAVDLAGGHQEGAVAVEAHHFGKHRRLAFAAHLADRADRHAHTGGLEHEAGDAHQGALGFQRLRQGGVGLQVGQVALPAQRERSGPSCVGVLRLDRAGVGPGQVLAESVGGLRPAAFDAGVDGAEVRLDAATAALDRGSATSRAPRACSNSPAPSATSGRSCGCTST
jgi:hypothetical protein